MITSEEKALLRELASRYAAYANSGEQQKKRARQIENNGLKPGRPPVLIDEVPWHEMDIDGQLTLRCTDEFARGMEQFFRRRLYQQRYFPCDQLIEPCYPIGKTIRSTGIGLEVAENTIALDGSNNIISHEYRDQLATEEDVAKIRIPRIDCDPEQDAKNVALAEEILGGILPVKLRGTEIYYAPWDQIIRYRGVENALYDMADRPEHIHAIVEKFTEIGLYTISRYEELGLLECEAPTLHCTPGLTDELPAKDYAGGPYRLKDVWIRSMAQMFSSVSPEMHREFDLDYSMKLFERCGMVYYGCCEPLDNKIDLLKKIPNMRKIGVSPWANVESCAEQIGGDYVYARKPNPANVAIRTDPEQIRQEIRETAEACIRRGCPYEFVLKDISTVSYHPENLQIWEQTVRETLDEIYG